MSTLATALLLAACGAGATRPDPPAPAPTSAVPSASSTPAANPARFAVGALTVDFTEASRGRQLHTFLHFPAVGQGAGQKPAAGAFPLVLMAHGFKLPAGGYERLLDAVTARGYVVAAPAFPHTSEERGDGNRADIVNQPADLSFLIGAVTDYAREHPDRLPAVADPTRVGAIGHSDGGLTVSAWAYNATFRDPRVAAAVVLTGGMALFPGSYFTQGGPPLLAVHGTGDETNPYSASVALFNAVPAGIPKYLLTIAGGSHLGPYMFDTARPELGDVIADFLDATLRGQPLAREQLANDATAAPGFSLRAG